MKVLPYRIYKSNEGETVLLQWCRSPASIDFPYMNVVNHHTYTSDGRFLSSDTGRTHPKTLISQVTVPHNTEISLDGKNYIAIDLDNDTIVVEIVKTKG